MGFYIERLADGRELPVKNKAQFLAENVLGASLIEGEPKSWMPDLICVISNPLFDAAGYAYDADEFGRFMPRRNDFRPRQWVRVPGAQQLSKYDPALAK